MADDVQEGAAETDLLDGLPSGATFGPFLIRRPLGRGGMAAVYEALDTRLDRAVALKVLPGAFLHDPTFSQRFENEARLVARLEHPNIVPIYATGIEAGVPWMSMRLLTGNNLGVLLDRRRLAFDEAVRLLRQVAAALDYAHAEGVVHRDIKPANILLDASGTACVADFGLAQLMESGSRLTRTGILTGTPHYMAPEQALGKRVDHHCDIYSLGIVAYEMLAGAPPFAADSPVALLLQHVHEPLPEPVDGSGLPWFEPIHKAAAKNPVDRWPSASAFIDALESSISAAPATAGDTSAGRLPPASSSRARLWAAVAGGAIVAAAALVWLPVPHSGRTTPDSANATAPAATAAVSPRTDAVPAPAPKDLGAATAAPRTSPRRPPAAGRAGAPPAEAPAAALTPAPSDAAPVGPAIRSGPPLTALPGDPLAIEPFTPKPAPTPPAPTVRALTAPEPIRQVTPPYPPAAVSAGLEGDVVLVGKVGVDGKVRDISVERSVHPLLDEAARRAWLQFEYKPAHRNGVPEAAPIRKTFKFAFRSE